MHGQLAPLLYALEVFLKHMLMKTASACSCMFVLPPAPKKRKEGKKQQQKCSKQQVPVMNMPAMDLWWPVPGLHHVAIAS